MKKVMGLCCAIAGTLAQTGEAEEQDGKEAHQAVASSERCAAKLLT
jgi:hypothetical protein